MADYNLFGLSTRSFEQMIQALAIPIFGPKIVVFGDGPDGGREATFNGVVPYPQQTGGWNGYGVIQAKFLQRGNGAGNDGNWALAQLKDELEKFPKKIPKVPQYYVFVTNVVLTPVANGGSKDKVYALLESEAERLGILGWDVWDYDKLRVFLDNNRDVATTYAAGIVTGDILASLTSMLNIATPDFLATLKNFLQKELLSDQYAHLEQAGHSPDDKILLSTVFTDLPVSDERLYEPIENLENQGIVSLLLETTSIKLNKAANPGRQRQEGRFVLIGGPGQGKTTIGQYFCQLFRAALLEGSSTLSAVAEDVVKKVAARCEEQGLSLPTFKRFPIRIELKIFAAALASGTATSVFSYIKNRLELRTDRPIPEAMLRQWLGTYSWLFVLDGLDEVPPSSNRDQLLASLDDFWVDLSECDADVFILATTRPQGYSNDFSPMIYTHKHLVPLPVSVSLRYGTLLANTRYGADPERADKIVSRLKRALTEQATARLMRSPLQVTIMATLVDKLGQPPDQRWALFKEYYKTIYDREVERQIPAAEVLRNKRPDIDLIHYRLGVLLQLECERRGQTDARLAIDKFRTMVSERLLSEGYRGVELASLVDSILVAAGERLVFIVGLEAGQVGFEIRSLQEFMAAEGLMDGSDEEVKERLRHIAPLDSWRQVFLFAAGKCFMERRHLREFIFSLCSELDLESSGVGHATVKVGSALALDILEDGASREQPKFEQMLVQRALSLLDVPVAKHHLRLGGIFSERFEGEYRSQIGERLGQQDPSKRIGAWTCLLALAKRNIPWAIKEVDSWEDNAEAIADEYGAAMAAAPIQGLGKFKQKILANNRIITFSRDISEAWWGRERLTPSEEPVASWFKVALALLNNTDVPPNNSHLECKIAPFFGSEQIQVSVVSVSNPYLNALMEIPPHSAQWEPHLAEAAFLANPNRMTLADALERSFESGILQRDLRNSAAPWPLEAFLQNTSSYAEAKAFGKRIRDGEAGDIKDWLVAEDRWKAPVGIEELACNSGEFPFGNNIGSFGFPPDSVARITIGTVEVSEELVKAINELPNSKGRDSAASLVLISCGFHLRTHGDRSLILSLADKAAQSNWGFLSGPIVNTIMEEPDWEDVLDRISGSTNYFFDFPADENIRLLVASICKNSERLGLVRLAARTAPKLGSVQNCNLEVLIHHTDWRVRLAALTLTVLSDGWGEEQLHPFAEVFANDAERSPKPDFLLAVERSSNDLSLRLRLLQTIINRVPNSQLGIRRSCFERINGILALKQSSLAESTSCGLDYVCDDLI